MMPKRYLSDGVYVDVDPRGLVLTTENGVSVTNEIVLDEDGVVGLMRYLQDVQQKRHVLSSAVSQPAKTDVDLQEIGEHVLQNQKRGERRRGGN
jgi:maltose-binding protein MalE